MTKSSRPERAQGVALLLALAGCSGEANHLGNPLLLPLSGVATAAENAVYGARRAEVSAYLAAYRAELQNGTGYPGLWAVAGVPPSRRLKVQGEIMAVPQGPAWVEQATVIVMVHRAP